MDNGASEVCADRLAVGYERVRTRSRCSIAVPSAIVGDDWRPASVPLRDKLLYLYEKQMLVDVTFHLYEPVERPSTISESALGPAAPVSNGRGHGQRRSSASTLSDSASSESSESSSESSESEEEDEGAGPDLVVQAHRLVLAMASPVFQKTLYSDGFCGRPVVIKNWSPGTFKLMIEFIYTGECIIASVEKARDIFHIAKAFQCNDLVRYISQFVSDAVESYHFTPLTCGNLFFFLDFSREVENQPMTQLCWSYVDQYAARIIASPDFNNLSKEMVATVLDRESFDAGDELVVFLAVKRWGEYRLRQGRCEPGPLRSVVADLLPFVKMDRIDEADFIKTVLPSGLVGPQELVSFFMTRGIEIPRNIDLLDNQSACRTLMEPGRRRAHGYGRCLRYRAGYKLTPADMETLHELRFRADKDLLLVGVHLGYVFSQLELGLTVRVQGPFERVQWTDMFSQYYRVNGDSVGTQPADMRVLFRQPVPIDGGCCYKVVVKVDRWKYTAGDFNVWGGQSGPSRARSDDGLLRFFFLGAAIEKGREICFADMEHCRGLVTELLYTLASA